uniref:2-cysteine adaptor domain-containing protein n=1 Tax=viral metagenome TaxID=1070528 RepID=A0A6C0J890_9ZZZZ
MSDITNTKLFTKEECLKWRMDPTRNPRTTRRIKVTGPTYKRLSSRSRKLLDSSTRGIDTCKTKWVKANEEYGLLQSSICCKCNSIKLLYLLHDDGDYMCYKCNEDVSVIYFCVSCRQKTDAE